MFSAYEDDLENGKLVQFAELLKTDVATVSSQPTSLIPAFHFNIPCDKTTPAAQLEVFPPSTSPSNMQ
ncbi:hypothetical protein HF086_004261 [Spodoptera exigua]|uniref:Uncharacterized protein n=1 Tax=Spodoptera exigua TaxID=7107 RepID=A0A922SNA5_SPOEX|nr:hypothetical protein HF086_004261 [Spodoptera exigua]